MQELAHPTDTNDDSMTMCRAELTCMGAPSVITIWTPAYARATSVGSITGLVISRLARIESAWSTYIERFHESGDQFAGPRAPADYVRLGDYQRTVSLSPGMTLDPNGIGRGLASDMILSELSRSGIPIIGACIDIGGDIALMGRPGGEDTWAFDVPVINDDSGKLAAHVRIAAPPDGMTVGLATSDMPDAHWRSTTDAGIIIDPRTGEPADYGIAQVTAITWSGWRSEAAATAAIILGDNAAAWLNGQGIAGLIVGRDGGVDVVNASPRVAITAV